MHNSQISSNRPVHQFSFYMTFKDMFFWLFQESSKIMKSVVIFDLVIVF